jgi:hypothetical protein
MQSDDRREFQRLKLAKPILATMDGESALIIDIGVAGAFLEHYGELARGHEFDLSFRWRGEDVAFRCEVARTTVVRTPGGDGASAVSHTGVRFVEPRGKSQARLHDMMATFVGRVLAAQKDNARGDISDSSGATILAELGGARRNRSRGYVTYHFRGDVWWRVPSGTAAQPEDGFTVAAFEDEDELEDLCRAYEHADEESRRLIRLVAELSALSVRV